MNAAAKKVTSDAAEISQKKATELLTKGAEWANYEALSRFYSAARGGNSNWHGVAELKMEGFSAVLKALNALDGEVIVADNTKPPEKTGDFLADFFADDVPVFRLVA